MLYFEKVKDNGVYIIVIDLCEIVMMKIVDFYLKIKFGIDVVFVNVFVKIMIDE